MTREAFDALIAEAIDRLPQRYAHLLQNVSVVSAAWPTPQDLSDGGVPAGNTLFGLYRGIPQTQRANYTNVLPDKITIFMGPLMGAYGNDPALLREQVYQTLLHEIGHHFGLTEENLRKNG